jgi:hypothetical protein
MSFRRIVSDRSYGRGKYCAAHVACDPAAGVMRLAAVKPQQGWLLAPKAFLPWNHPGATVDEFGAKTIA